MTTPVRPIRTDFTIEVAGSVRQVPPLWAVVPGKDRVLADRSREQMDDFIRWRATFSELSIEGNYLRQRPLHMEHKRRLTSSGDGEGLDVGT
jgi:hypothetical protein